MQSKVLPTGFVSRHGFTLLFVMLLLFMIVVPVAHQLHSIFGVVGTPIFEGITFTILMAVAVLSVSKHRMARWIAIALAVPAIVLSLVHFLVHSPLLEVFRLILGATFLGYVVGVLMQFIFRAEQITYNTVCASLCIYLLLGVVWAFAYSLIAMGDPGAFGSTQHGDVPPVMLLGSQTETPVLYFSFTTLTTLGYGDIVPATPIARMLAVTEAITGQLFLTVLVARLVGMHITQSLEANKK